MNKLLQIIGLEGDSLPKKIEIVITKDVVKKAVIHDNRSPLYIFLSDFFKTEDILINSPTTFRVGMTWYELTTPINEEKYQFIINNNMPLKAFANRVKKQNKP